MMHRPEIIHGAQSAAPALVKHAVRFGRRLRDHNIYHGVFPSLIDDEATVCKVAVGRRVANIFKDGSFTASLRTVDRDFERGAFIAQSNRMHAILLDLASHARARGLKAHARADLQLAAQERRHHERAN